MRSAELKKDSELRDQAMQRCVQAENPIGTDLCTTLNAPLISVLRPA